MGTGDAEGLGSLVGRSAAMRAIYGVIQRVAAFHVDVLITGETGTGKELVARCLHEYSARSEGPFTPVDAGAIPNELIERELFGHEAGAFTGARTRGIGMFETASGGTLFLDEIGNLPITLQVKLLRVLQERIVRRLGAVKGVAVDVRIVAATSMDLMRAMEEGRFRSDLYHRINVVRIDLPPLRSRTGDVTLLADHFLARDCARFGRETVRLTEEAIEALETYKWPGNVRELENVIQRTMAMSQGDVVGLEHLPPEVRTARKGERRWSSSDPRTWRGPAPLDDVVRDHILAVLEHVDDNRSRAAKILGIDPKTLRRKLRAYGRR